MSSADDFQVQNVYRYSRRSYKKPRRPCQDDNRSHKEDSNTDLADQSPRRNETNSVEIGQPGCSCVLDCEGDIRNTWHQKCPPISLGQEQLQMLLESTDRLLCNNTRCCKSVYDFVCMLKMLCSQHWVQCALVIMIGVGFCFGVLVGAASCGTYLGRFNSPILTCIDRYFARDSFDRIQDSFHSIA